MNLGIRYLKSSQHANGTWSEYAGHEGGVTALCTLALLNAGESPDERARQEGARLSPQAASQDDLCRFSANHGPLPCDPCRRPGRHRPQRPMAGRDPGQERPGRPQRRLVVRSSPNERSIEADGSNSQFALLALYEAGPRGRNRPDPCHHPPRDLGTRPHLLDQQPARGRRLAGATRSPGRHRQHDLCRHCRAW